MNGELFYDEIYASIQFSALRVLVIDSWSQEFISSRLFYTNYPDYHKELEIYLSSIYPGNTVILVYTKMSRNSNLSFLLNFKFSKCFKLIKESLSFFILGYSSYISNGTCYFYKNYNFPFEDIDFSIITYKIQTNLFNCESRFENMDDFNKRKIFCDKFFAFNELCDCDNLFILKNEKLDPIYENMLSKIPVLIIASNRPQYFFQLLKSILKARGAQPSMITIDLDEDNPELIGLADLFGLKIQKNIAKCGGTCRINNHYRSSLLDIRKSYSKLEFVFIFEDDLIVSSDIFYYFTSLLEVYQSDNSIFCISAWNDHVFIF